MYLRIGYAVAVNDFGTGAPGAQAPRSFCAHRTHTHDRKIVLQKKTQVAWQVPTNGYKWKKWYRPDWQWLGNNILPHRSLQGIVDFSGWYIKRNVQNQGSSFSNNWLVHKAKRAKFRAFSTNWLSRKFYSLFQYEVANGKKHTMEEGTFQQEWFTWTRE